MWFEANNRKQNLDSSFKLENTEVLLCPFQLKTLPVNKTPLKVKDEPPICCTSSNLYIAIATHKNVSIFKEESFELLWDVQTKEKVCCISLSDDSCLLLVAEISGQFQLFHISTKTLLWSYVCQNAGSSSMIEKAFFTQDSAGSLKIHIFTQRRIAFEFSTIFTSSMNKGIENGSMCNAFDAVHVKELDLSTLYPEYAIRNIFQTFCNSPSVGLGIQCVTKSSNMDFFFVEGALDGELEADWEWNSNDKHSFQCYDFSAYDNAIKALSTRDGKYVVFLNEKHILHIMCPFTSNICKLWRDHDSKSCIKDFVLNETINPSSFLVSECKIGLLLETVVADRGHVFEIRKFPSFQLIFNIDLSHFVKIVDCKLNQDFWYIVDGEISTDNSGEKYLNNLSVKAIFEALPEARLMSLISRRKFHEAEKLAKISSLSSEVIYKAKINCILSNLSANKHANALETEFESVWNELEESFKHVKDVEFVKSVIFCSLPNANLMKRVLLCVKHWLINNGSIEDTQDIISQVNQCLNKLITHEILSSTVDSCVFLKDFLDKDLLNYMISELKFGKLTTAFIIWQRHKDELLLALNAEAIKNIVTAIPDSVTSLRLIPFLCDDFLPSVFSRNPSSIDMVADWLIDRVYLIELCEKDLWPKNGMELVTGFLKIIKDLQEKEKTGEISLSTSVSLASFHKKFASTEFSVGRLAKFVKDLTWLVALKSDLHCKVSLSDFQDSKMSVIFAVLDRVNIQHVPRAIEDFARPFALENDLELDLCLEQYIKRSLQTSSFTWWSWDEEPWEERLIAVTENILSTSRWANAALMIAGRASVPWSERMKKLIKKGTECDCNRSEEFQMQSQLVGLKEVLLKYDMKSFPINKDKKLIYVLVNYIFKQNKESVLEDAKKVLMSVSDHTLESDIYYKYLQFALGQNKVDQMIEVFSTLPQDTAIICASRLLRYIKLYLDDKFLVQEQKELTRNMLYTGIYLIEFLQKTKKSFFEEELLIPFKNLTKLEEEFNICMTFSKYSSRSECRTLIQSVIHDLLTKNTLLKKVIDSGTRKHMPISSSISRLYRLGDILLFEREEIMAFLITSCLEEQKYDLVLKLCKELTVSSPTCETANTLVQVVEHFYLNFRSIKDVSFRAMIDMIHHLISVAVTYCKKELIQDHMNAVHLSIYLCSIRDICGQHSRFIPPEFTVDAFHKWKFYPFYQDEGFQLDCEKIADFILTVSKEFIREPNVTMTELALSEHGGLISRVRPIIEHMTEKGHGIACLKTLLYCYHMDTQNLRSAENIVQVYSTIFQDVCKTVFSITQGALRSQRRIDLYFIYNLLAILPEAEQFLAIKSLLRWCSNDLNRLTSVARVAMELSRLLEKSDAFSTYESIYMRASLLSKSKIRSVPMEVILGSSNPQYNWSVVKNLIVCQKVDLPTVYECCAAFQLRTDAVLILYLNNILLECERKYLNCELTDKEVIPVLRKAKDVIRCIEDEELLYNNFINMTKKISPYSYEILLFIEEQLHSISADIRTINSSSFEKNIKLLKFLKVYERTSPVCELEHKRWCDLQPTNPKLPPLASKHLPFHFFLQENPHVVINPELNANTLDVWLKIAPVLKVSEDHLIIKAIKNNVMEYMNRHSSPHILFNPDIRFIGIINNMISKAKNKENSVASASWVTNVMPPGGNKVSFADMAVKYAQDWYENTNEPFVDVYNKLVSHKQKSAIERSMYKNNLATDAILSMTHSPIQLIEHLIEEFTFNLDQSIKACKAILDIGEIVEIDLAKVFLKYIFKWLNVTQSTTANLDETFLALSPVAEEWKDHDDIDGKNILRIINLLLSLPEYLFPTLNKAFKDSFKDMANIQRTRLLFCFVSVFDSQTVAECIGWDPEVLEAYLIPLICSVELENLNLPYSLQIFENCNKTELIQSILYSNTSNPKAIIFCVRLCLEFNIWDAAIWEVILKRMTLKAMDSSLREVLPSVQGHLSHLWHKEIFIDAWKCILSTILRDITDVTSLMSKLYKAILRCPCVSSLDVKFLTKELNYIIRTSDQKIVKEVESITDIPSLVSNLMKIVENHSQHEEI